MGTTKKTNTNSRTHSTRERIEQEAIAIFSEKGYDATSMRELAEASGVTKPVIYYYFKNKENLCHSLIRSGLEEFRQRMESVCNSDGTDVFADIVRLVQSHFDFCKGNTEFMRFIHALNFGPDRKKINYDFFSYGMDLFRMQAGLMRRASRAGIIRKGKEEAAVYYLRGIISTYVMLYVDGRGQLPRGLARTIVNDMVHGLGKPGFRRS
jgi:AcrR family transcriptional regulator